MRPFRDDSGKVALFTVIVANFWVFMLGLVVVGGGRMRAYQRADNIAAEAARAAGSAIEAGQAVQGGEKVVDPVKAQQAASSYITAAGATGKVAVADDRTHLIVTVYLEYTNPSGLAFLGGATWTATGVANATLLVG
ncbi:hypothetical protein [Allorhizocola rhizosphaerae]|uniref:hypothetical protein n=1 Tax=Allorhizocola rhizosphaerae TaxID=1872709 RepID=UPI000E3C93D6|nr:hypothetical protein [Allorhizocola rhizosphaerae]